ncbi:hypothetical protein [Amaricoccus sp.]|uniref:hypothetical protein n=1 Tax=Amaricoccus sp. TaxID=1872485 RepID=UPI0025BDAEDC|nr:hypothetical protein [Amaricoccus sp.]
MPRAAPFSAPALPARAAPLAGRGSLAAALAGATLLAAPAVAQEGGAIRTGEHPGFTRIVMTIEPTTEWSLETAPGEATILFPGRRLAFGVEGVWERIPRDRVDAIETSVAPEGTRVVVGLACDCRVSASFVGARHLALDIGDRGAVPPAPPVAPAGTAEARERREAEAVASAEAALIANLSRAAEQGVVVMSPAEAPPAPQPAAAQPHAQAPAPEPTARPEPRPAGAPPAALAALALLDQVEAISVYDRDGAALAAALSQPAPAPACLPDAALDIAAWGGTTPLPEQSQPLLRHLVGEFDKADPETLDALARLYLRLGLGAEAESLLAGFGVPLPDGPLLVAMARTFEGRPVDPEGPLAVAEICPGRHGLWLALAGAGPAWRGEAQFASVQEAFADLPVDLRAILGPPLALRLLDAGRPAAAREIETTTIRAGATPSDALALVDARLLAAEGKPEAAASALRAIAESGSPAAMDALVALTRLAIAEGYVLPDRLVLDLRAAAAVQRGDPREVELRAVLVEGLAARGDLQAAMAEVARARADLPASRRRFARLGVAAVAGAAPDRVGTAAYAEAALAARPLFLRGPGGDEPRRATAESLIAVGLPNAALELLRPALLRGDPDSRRLAARAELALGRPDAALAALVGLSGPVTAGIRAAALARRGAPAEAVAALDAAGDADAAAGYAWASGDWARAAATGDADRAAMAAYMAARAGAAAAAPDAATPEAAAFVAPLPRLDRPSLGAARSLIERGPAIGAFVGGLIATDPPAAD